MRIYLWLAFYLVCLYGAFILIGGDCDYPTDIASDGSKCGGRAASERDGGRHPTGDLVLWVILFCGAVCVLIKAYKAELDNFFKSGRFSDEEKPTFISSHPPFNNEAKKYEWDGPWSQNFKNGQVMAEGTFSEGKEVGDWREYYDNGNLRVEKKFDRDGTRQFTSYYYENGNLHRRGLIEGGYRTGVWEQYHGNGQLFMKQNVDDDKRNGEEIWYFEDGTIEREKYFKNGKPIGVWKEYNMGGQLERETHYEKYSKSIETSYHENGPIEWQRFYENGEPVGVWKEYYLDGQLESETHYENYKRVLQYCYFENGQLKSSITVQDGIESQKSFKNILTKEEEKKLGCWI